MLDKTNVINLAGKYANSIQTILKPQKVILYGSYAKGQANPNSDIDIAIIVDTLKDMDYLNTMQQLYKCRRDISLDIEPVLLDNSDNASGFLSEVLKTGIVISE